MNTIADVLFVNPAIDPDREAIVLDDRRMTFATLQSRVRKFANALVGLGVRKGDRVCVLLGNRPEFLESYFAITALGGLYVPLNGRLSAREHATIMEDAAPSILISSPEYAPTIEAARTVASLRAIILAGQAAPGLLDYETCLAGGADALPAAALSSSDDAAIVYTSGTTSTPKGVVLSHGNYLADWHNVSTVVLPRPEGANLQIAPLYHAALVQTMVHLRAGARTVLLPKFDPDRVLHLIEREHITHMFGVPTVLYALLDHHNFPSTDCCSLRTVTYGGAPMTLQRLNEAIAALGYVLIHAYGATETTSHCSILPGAEHTAAFGSVGRPLPLCEMKIADDRGNELGPGEIGEILVKGPNVMQRYWNRPDATAETLVDGWVHTGDIGRRDERGYYYVIDRKKDMIISGGVNIYPKDIEEVIAQHPAVAEVAVFGVADPRWGESVAASVRLRPGCTATPEELQGFLDGRVGRYQIPKQVNIVEDFPRNATGKIMKHVLRSEATTPR